MAIIENTRRTNMHQVLREKLTVDAADTLMDHLPPGGWSDVATKSDIELLRSEMVVQHVAIKSDIEQLRSEVAVQHASTKSDVEQLRSEMVVQHASTKSDVEQLRSEMAVQHASTKSDIVKLAASTDVQFANLRTEIEKGFKSQARWSAGYMASLTIALIVAYFH